MAQRLNAITDLGIDHEAVTISGGNQIHDVLFGFSSFGDSVNLLEVSVTGSSYSSQSDGFTLSGSLIAGVLQSLDAAFQSGDFGTQIGDRLSGSQSGEGSLQGVGEVSLGDLVSEGQLLQAGNSNSGTSNVDGAVFGAGFDQQFSDLVGDGQSGVVDLDAFQNVGFAASSNDALDVGDDVFNLGRQDSILSIGVGLGGLQAGLQLGQSSEFGHNGFPPKIKLFYSLTAFSRKCRLRFLLLLHRLQSRNRTANLRRHQVREQRDFQTAAESCRSDQQQE